MTSITHERSFRAATIALLENPKPEDRAYLLEYMAALCGENEGLSERALKAEARLNDATEELEQLRWENGKIPALKTELETMKTVTLATAAKLSTERKHFEKITSLSSKSQNDLAMLEQAALSADYDESLNLVEELIKTSNSLHEICTSSEDRLDSVSTHTPPESTEKKLTNITTLSTKALQKVELVMKMMPSNALFTTDTLEDLCNIIEDLNEFCSSVEVNASLAEFNPAADRRQWKHVADILSKEKSQVSPLLEELLERIDNTRRQLEFEQNQHHMDFSLCAEEIESVEVQANKIKTKMFPELSTNVN